MDDLADAPDAVRPLVLGYVHAHFLMTEPELTALERDLQLHADREGYQLGKVFVERVDQVPTAFGALLAAVECDRAEAIVIPSLRHLMPLGIPPKLVYHLRTVTGVRVLLADNPSRADEAGSGVPTDHATLTAPPTTCKESAP